MGNYETGNIFIPDTSFLVAMSQRALWGFFAYKWLNDTNATIVMIDKVEAEMQKKVLTDARDEFGVPLFLKDENLEIILGRFPTIRRQQSLDAAFSASLDSKLVDYKRRKNKTLSTTDKSVLQAAMEYIRTNLPSNSSHNPPRVAVAFGDEDHQAGLDVLYKGFGTSILYFSPFNPPSQEETRYFEGMLLAMDKAFGTLHKKISSTYKMPFLAVKKDVTLRGDIKANIGVEVVFRHPHESFPKEDSLSFVPIYPVSYSPRTKTYTVSSLRMFSQKEAVIYCSKHPHILVQCHSENPVPSESLSKFRGSGYGGAATKAQVSQFISGLNHEFSPIPRIDDWHLKRINPFISGIVHDAQRMLAPFTP
jgi:hypothetical protein